MSVDEPRLGADDYHEGSHVEFLAFEKTRVLHVFLDHYVLKVFDDIFEILFLDRYLFSDGLRGLLLWLLVSPFIFTQQKVLLELGNISAHFHTFALVTVRVLNHPKTLIRLV